MVQINKRNTSHKQKERQKSHDHINRCGKVFDKVQRPFVIKILSTVRIEGTFLNIIKTIFEKPTVSIIPNRQKPKAFSLISGTRQGCALSSLLST